MKKPIIIVVAVAALSLAVNCFAGHKPEEAKAMVKKAIAFIRANGKEKALPVLNQAKGPFTRDELYVFVYDSKGVLKAYSQNHDLVGKNMLDLKDADGKYFVKEFLTAGRKGSGWVEYKWMNPVKKRVEQKKTYLEAVDDLVVGCGVYEE